ncbi:MAG: DUF4131 domain-containing protein, partial [Actinomycetales bacterium]|nr:DUF4131 domain-containing protein [Actinomycetales bacterium]
MRPTDLRLVPAALVAWLGAVLLVALPAAHVAAVAGLALAVGIVAGFRGRAPRAARGPTSAPPPRSSRHASLRGHTVLVPLALAAVATSAAGQLALREAGPLDGLVADRAVVTLEGVVRSEPAPLTAREGHRVVLAVRAVAGRGLAGGAAARVLVLGDGEWAKARYGERVRATVRLGPTEPGEDVVALAHGVGPPTVVAAAGPVDRTVTALREGLLDVTAGLAPDA